MGTVVIADIWRVRRRFIPAALLAVARDRRALRTLPGARFVKILGTAPSFDSRGADLTRWMILTAWADATAAEAARNSRTLAAWQHRSEEWWTATLRPLTAHGSWSRRQPFETSPDGWEGPLAAVTRARLVPVKALQFWRAVSEPAADLAERPGLCLALAMGEAPVGVQGTFSVWRDAAALREYAYGRPAHRDVVRRTREVGWYAEELFARFAVLSYRGTVDGRDPLEQRP
jgi:heme-degrading monooxygenase HmoA